MTHLGQTVELHTTHIDAGTYIHPFFLGIVPYDTGVNVGIDARGYLAPHARPIPFVQDFRQREARGFQLLQLPALKLAPCSQITKGIYKYLSKGTP